MSAQLEQAIAHMERGEISQAQRLVDNELSANPLDADAWHLRGLLALRSAKLDDAVASLGRAINFKPDNASIYVNYAAALNSRSQYEEACNAARRAMKLDAASAQARYQLGLALTGLSDHVQAAAALTEATELQPGWLAAREALSNCLFQSGEHDRAFAIAQETLRINPDAPISRRVVADYLTRHLRYEEALEEYQKALLQDPNNPLVHNNYALLLVRMGMDDESLKHYEKAVSLSPDLRTAREGYAFSMLARGEFEKGWPHYIGRGKPGGALFIARPGPPTATAFSDLHGKRVLTWLDQGVGDQVLFLSLVPDFASACAELTVECEPRLVPLVARSFPNVGVRATARDLPHPGDDRFDYQIYIPDAARWFRRSFSDFPRHHGYLKADGARISAFRKRYKSMGRDRPVIGISWRTATIAKVHVQKTLQLKDWGPILKEREATFVNLQYGDCRSEIHEASDALNAPIYCDEKIDSMEDLDAFAAQVAAMDLVITTSNATAHVAGSLNVPVWTLVPRGFGAMWHWFLAREDSPWYPSMSILRQPARGDWASVLNQAATKLTDFLMARQK